MLERARDKPYFAAGVLITLANVILVWAFRFLPLYDYPIWLYEVRMMRVLTDPMFVGAYEIADVPVPNLGFVGIVYLLSFIVSIEVAGKIFLTLCAVGLPWSFWYCVRKLSANPDTPLAYAAFPFAFNAFFFGGQAFLVGLIVVVLMIGYYVPRLERLSIFDWGTLSLLFFLCYFIHALTFVLIVIVFACVIFFVRRRGFLSFGLTLIPSLMSLYWYLLKQPPHLADELRWSVWGFAQKVFKPLFLFIKSYGIPNPLPLTIMNLLWVVLLSLLLYQLWVRVRTHNKIERSVLISSCFIFVLGIALPEMFLGVVQPGSRFALAALFLVLLSAASAKISDKWKPIFLAVALTVNMYNAYHFTRVDRQMQELFSDINSTGKLQGSAFCSIRFDWPPERRIWDVAAASIDPLFGGVYYAAMESGGPTWIFGTSLLRAKKARMLLSSIPQSFTTDELATVVLTQNGYYFSVITLVGNSAAAERTYEEWPKALPSSLVTRTLGTHWRILRTSTSTKLTD